LKTSLPNHVSLEEGVTEHVLHLIEGYGLVRVMAAENSPLIGVSVTEHKN